MPDVSFEIYPPKSKEGSLQLRQAMRQLAKFDPKFTSVTCGTGGGSVKSTKDTVQALQAQEIGEIGAHVTCGNRTLADLTGLTHYYRQNNVSAVVALRGDAPSDISNGPTVPEFVSTLRRTTNLDIYVAAYPQVHPKARNLATDLDALKEKQDAGANAAITQFFFDADVFLRFRDLAIANGVTMPLIPGILPVTNWAATRSMAIACGATIEPDLAEGFARAAREDRAKLMATAHASELCHRLTSHGVEHLHFYTMNRSNVVSDICTALGVPQKRRLRCVA